MFIRCECISTSNSSDSFIGWNGGNFVIAQCDGAIVAALGTIPPDGSADTNVITVEDCDVYVLGCTDSLAFNYNSEANLRMVLVYITVVQILLI